MRISSAYSPARGQTSLEYLLLLAVVAVVVIAAFGPGSLVSQIHDTSQGYYNTVTRVIMANETDGSPTPIDGGWCGVTCPAAGFGFNKMYGACECPAPAFGGKDCPGINTSTVCPAGATCYGFEVSCTGSKACGTCPTGEECMAGGTCGCANSLKCGGPPNSGPIGSVIQNCTACVCLGSATYDKATNTCVTCPPTSSGQCQVSTNGNTCSAITCPQYETCDNWTPTDAGYGTCECDTGTISNGSGGCTPCGLCMTNNSTYTMCVPNNPCPTNSTCSSSAECSADECQCYTGFCPQTVNGVFSCVWGGGNPCPTLPDPCTTSTTNNTNACVPKCTLTCSTTSYTDSNNCSPNDCSANCSTSCTSGQCAPSCSPTTCAVLGDNCGTPSDGCGSTLNCGTTCPNGQTCGGGGTPYHCGNSCATCASLGDNCGNVSDGCGNILNCGTTCPNGGTCGGRGVPNQCGTCSPVTCAQLGDNCGSISDTCGGTLNCGTTCPNGGTCGGGGTPNVCGSCNPATCATLGDNCGNPPDGCGGTLTCGKCTQANYSCVSYGCQCSPNCTVCGAPDGCGNTCKTGTCSVAGQTCDASTGQCVTPACSSSSLPGELNLGEYPPPLSECVYVDYSCGIPGFDNGLSNTVCGWISCNSSGLCGTYRCAAPNSIGQC